MIDRQPVEGIGTWSEGAALRFEQAKQALQALIAAYAELSEGADAETAARLQAEQVRYGRQLIQLDPTDTALLDAIITDYPSLAAQVRAGKR